MNSIDSFEALPLAAPLQRALADKGYATPSPIQAQAIPVLIEGRDLLGSAQTGTGKTAAFSLPILHQIHERPQRLNRHGARALVLTPTRELAVQVAKSFETYGQNMRLSCAQVYGGVSQGPQVRALRRGVDVLIATPGRLLDLFEQGHIDFSTTEFLVLDEADRMLDMGFIHDIKRVVAELPEERQSLFFSATLSPEVTKLAQTILTDPVEIRLAPQQTTAENIDHRICFLQQDDKMDLLVELLNDQAQGEERNLTLVFSRTKFGADRIAKNLTRAGVRAEAIHGNKSQNARQRALEKFRAGKSPVLVATDVAARGIDVKNVTLVVNYDLPNEPEAYVHRIGRTARAGEDGVALSFCTTSEMGDLAAIERLIRKEIPVHADHAFHDEEIANRRKKGGKRTGFGSKSGRRPNGRNRKPGGGRPFRSGGKGRPGQRNRRRGPAPARA